MKIKSLKTPIIIISLALILMVASYFLTSMQKKPTVTEHDFEYSVTYKVDGETKTFNGVYSCRFSGFGDNGTDPLERYYTGEFTTDGVADPSRRFTIVEKDGYTLDIITLFDDSYLMGETQEVSYNEYDAPFLEAKDENGNQYDETDFPIEFNAEIVSWKYPEPIENSFEFAGFSGFYITNMAVMLLLRIIALVLCMIFVKKDEGVVYSALDIIGIVLNFVVAFIVIPIDFLAASLIQAFPTGPDWIYQAYLVVPQIMALSLAASVSLRRKGYRLSGFLIQFLGIVLLTVLIICEYIL